MPELPEGSKFKKMSGLFSRIKGGRKKSKLDLPPSSTGQETDTSEPISDLPLTQSLQASPVNDSYAVPVVQASSIFSGLHLSSNVAGSESPDSSYVKSDGKKVQCCRKLFDVV